MNKLHLRKLFSALLTGLIVAAFAFGQTMSKQDKKERDAATKTSGAAAKVFNETMRAPDKAIPRDLLDRAEAVAIFPGVIKAAFIFGGRGGMGIISRRTATGWSAPAFFKIGGGSVGPQIGAEKIDYIMLIMNENGLKGLLDDKFEIGAEANVAAGPVGRATSVSTNTTFDANILSYSRAKGLFAGVALKGAVITPDNDRNNFVYRRRAAEILTENSDTITIPAYVQVVPMMLTRYSARKGSGR